MSLPAPVQADLFTVETQIEFDTVEMGVLENGIAYLSEAGLARMCGIDRKTLYELSIDWVNQKQKQRGRKIEQLLLKYDYHENFLFLKAKYSSNIVNAYTEPVCMAILEYYAFDTSEPKAQAINAYRNLAGYGFKSFIYRATGYNPSQKTIDSWKHFHDRIDMTLNAVPLGYFSVFREIASMIVPMIRAKLIISDRVIPDISVGKAWSAYWTENNLQSIHGDRRKFDHDYPDYYPQSKSNPQPSWCYPNSCLGDFRDWLQTNYIANKFPAYLIGQVKKKTIDKATADTAIETFKHKLLN